MGIEIFTMSTSGGGLLLVGGVPLSATLTAITDQFGNVSPLQIATASVRMTAPTFLTLPNWTNTLGSKDGFFSSQSINVPSAGNGVFRMIRNDYTINNTGAQTGSVTGIFQNAIETNLNGITHNLLDLQLNSVSRFSVSRLGIVTAEGLTSTGNIINSVSGAYQWLGRSRMVSPSDGIITFLNNGSTDFNRLQFGGTTNSFPALERYGSGLRVRTADNSGFGDFWADKSYFSNVMAIGTTLPSPSAQVQIDSTQRGFLMPRMAETQITAIASPADGLMVYNTTIQAPCFYNGLTMQWQKISHSIM